MRFPRFKARRMGKMVVRTNPRTHRKVMFEVQGDGRKFGDWRIVKVSPKKGRLKSPEDLNNNSKSIYEESTK